MGLGSSKLSDDLATSQRELAAARERCRALEAQNDALQTESQARASQLQQSEAYLAVAGQEHERTLRAAEDELNKAIKQRQLAEELRRSDALLAKRIMCAQLKQAGVSSAQDASSVVAEGTLAAQLALAAEDEVQLRQVRAASHTRHRAAFFVTPLPPLHPFTLPCTSLTAPTPLDPPSPIALDGSRTDPCFLCSHRL